MKALEILKNLREDHTYDHIVSYDASMKEVKEAISELEEAMKTKTCEGCKWNAQVGDVGIFHCWKSRELHYCQAKGFIDYCNEFEPKDNA